jgi:hypothetical protein
VHHRDSGVLYLPRRFFPKRDRRAERPFEARATRETEPARLHSDARVDALLLSLGDLSSRDGERARLGRLFSGARDLL